MLYSKGAIQAVESVALRTLTKILSESSTSPLKPSPKSVVPGWIAIRATLPLEVLFRYSQRIWRGSVCIVIGQGAF
jgi:hypothetical protein